MSGQQHRGAQSSRDVAHASRPDALGAPVPLDDSEPRGWVEVVARSTQPVPRPNPGRLRAAKEHARQYVRRLGVGPAPSRIATVLGVAIVALAAVVGARRWSEREMPGELAQAASAPAMQQEPERGSTVPQVERALSRPAESVASAPAPSAGTEARPTLAPRGRPPSKPPSPPARRAWWTRDVVEPWAR